MLIKDIKDCKYYKAMDNTILCELLHPKNISNLKINCSIAQAILKVGESSLSHKLNISAEIYYILEGNGIMHIDDESEEVHPGQAIYIPAGSKQYIENIGKKELKFLCIVNPMWKEEDEELVEEK
ncbi:MAG: cupin domain-containing protein [Methanobacterium sp.]